MSKYVSHLISRHAELSIELILGNVSYTAPLIKGINVTISKFALKICHDVMCV